MGCVMRRVRVTCTGVAKRQRTAKWRTTGKNGEKGVCLVLGVGCRGTRSLLTRPNVESSRKTGLTGDRRSGGATSEELGEKKARSVQTQDTDGHVLTEP